MKERVFFLQKRRGERDIVVCKRKRGERERERER
jgi:hypothetical protein